MRDIILEVKAEAEAELLMAKAKVAVAESMLEKYDARFCTTTEVVTDETEEVLEDTTDSFTNV